VVNDGEQTDLDGVVVPQAECPFCGVVAGEAPAEVVYEDDETLAFLDIEPATDGHTLVVPKKHIENLLEATVEDATAVMRGVHQVAGLLEQRLRPDGITLFQANRAVGWQDVMHLHVHVVPRYSEDQLLRPWQGAHEGASALCTVAVRLRGPV
jgi:histidine triad (HIT) family protein